MKSFLAGLGLGIGIGVLFAPMRGEDTRELVAVRTSELADKARQGYDKVQSKIEGMAGTLRDIQGRAEDAVGRSSEQGEPRTGTNG